MRYLESTTTKASPDMFWANLDVYRLGVESSSGFFCPLAESVERTASSMFTLVWRLLNAARTSAFRALPTLDASRWMSGVYGFDRVGPCELRVRYCIA